MSEKLSVRMHRQSWQHLLALLEKQSDRRSGQIAERIKCDILQADIHRTKRELEELSL